MLLRIDCPDCPDKYAWQVVQEELLNGAYVIRVSLSCVRCGHLGVSTADHPRVAAAGAIECYRIQTTAKEESG